MKESVEYPLREGRNLIGRGTKWGAADVDLTAQEIPGQTKIAPEHAQVIIDQGTYFLQDTHSNKGTWLNGRQLPPDQPQPLHPGDLIQLAAVRLRFLTAPESKPEKVIPLAPLRLVCVRGMKPGAEYPLFEGENLVGWGIAQPLEIDLDDQRETDRPYLSARHARIVATGGALTIEDLKSERGTYVNGQRIPPETKQPIQAGDILLLGGVRLAVVPAEAARSFAVPAPISTRLHVLRGANPKLEYRLYEGDNCLGRPDLQAVDVDLSEQESPDKALASIRHAVITCANGKLTIEDLDSKDGTFVNRVRIKPRTKVPLHAKDTIHIGALQFQVGG